MSQLNDWDTTKQMCERLHNGSYLAAINSAFEQKAIETFLDKETQSNLIFAIIVNIIETSYIYIYIELFSTFLNSAESTTFPDMDMGCVRPTMDWYT